VREYETTIIVQPEISADGTEALLAKMDSVLERASSVRLMCADLGKRKLAYEVRKFHKGHYYTLSFCDEGQVIPDLERNLRMEESVLRFMTVLVDDSVADVSVRMERGKELEAEQQKRAVEKAEREAEEARAREEIERQAAEDRVKEEAAAAEAAKAAAVAAEAAGEEGAEAAASDAAEGEAAPSEGAAAEAAPETPAEAATEEPAVAATDAADAGTDASTDASTDAKTDGEPKS
jgi:small subunit ribosomal protein S6